MVVRLRLQRFGRKHAPFYRMVAADSRAPRDGKFLEIVSSIQYVIQRMRPCVDRILHQCSLALQRNFFLALTATFYLQLVLIF